MLGIIKGSVVIGFVTQIAKLLGKSYGTSRLKCFVDGAVNCFRQSVFYGTVKKYFYKPAYFEYSLTYKFILWLVSVLDIAAAAIGRALLGLIKGSNCVDAAKAATEADAADILKTIGIVCIFLTIGYAVGILIKGADAAAFVIPAAVLVFGLIALLLSRNLNVVKMSCIYRFFAWLAGFEVKK